MFRWNSSVIGRPRCEAKPPEARFILRRYRRRRSESQSTRCFSDKIPNAVLGLAYEPTSVWDRSKRKSCRGPSKEGDPYGVENRAPHSLHLQITQLVKWGPYHAFGSKCQKLFRRKRYKAGFSMEQSLCLSSSSQTKLSKL